jgi:hypothetical protein
VGLQELLVYFDPWIAGVMLPLAIIIGLCAIPYFDPSRKAEGVYSLRERPLAFTIFTVGLVAWTLLIVIGSWFRGPGWLWVWPWDPVATGSQTDAVRSIPNAIGVPLVVAYFVGGGWLIARWTRSWADFTTARRWTFALLLLAMGGTLIKILMRLLMGIKYVVSFESVGFNI